MSKCNYINAKGIPCHHQSEHNQKQCFWHNADIKTEKNLRYLLEERAKDDYPMTGFQLRKANLEGVNLVHGGHKEGYQLNNADLYRANLKEAHLFACNLKGSSLMKADLRYANLHCAKLEGCNLLGVRLEGARLEGATWGNEIIQEKMSRESKVLAEKMDYWQQAEEIYRNLRKASEQAGLFETSGHFFEREMVMRRYQMPLFSNKRFYSKVVDMFCGYGERPIRVVMFSLMAIITFGLLYASIGIHDGEEVLKWDQNHSFTQNAMQLLTCLYFSVVTFTTLGYGDLTPFGLSRFLAAVEAFIGSFTLALFVVVFVKKMTR